MRCVGAILVLLVVALASTHALPLKGFKGALNRGLEQRGVMLGAGVGAATEQWFTQNVDHFELANTKQFQQRYFVNDTFWKGPGAPIFLMIGGEGPLSAAYVADHFVTGVWSQQFGAMVVALEHRFYGKSMPTPDSSAENLKLLSSQQALHDLATFRAFIASKYGAESSKWIAFGGSYSANLSAWARLKYPHLFHGSFASSGPVHALEHFYQYFEVVEAALSPIVPKNSNRSCTTILRAATDAVEQLMQTSSGLAQLQTLFKTCSPIKTEKDKAVFFEQITDPICGVVQYNKDNNGANAQDIEVMCDQFATSSDPLQSLAQYVVASNGGQCMVVDYHTYLNDLMPTSAGRSWTYQTCTEFGYYQTGQSNARQPFSSIISLDFFRGICKDVYGQDMPVSPNTALINTVFGSTDIRNVASNTFFGDGTIDPWHALAVLPSSNAPGTQMLGSNSATVLITGTAHCADLYAPSPRDLPELTAARKVAVQLLETWLQQ